MPTTRSAPTGAGDDRKKALEAKKAKLAQMRAEKERRLQEKKKVEQEKSQQTQQTVKEKLEIDDQVQNIMKEQNLTTNTEPNASQTPQVSASSSNLPIDSNIHIQAPNSTSQSQNPIAALSRAIPTLSKSSISHYELTPKEIISYAKETQTAVIATDCDDLAENNQDESEDKTKQNSSEAQTGEKIENSDQSDETSQVPTEEQPEVVKELTQDELEQIHKSDQFWQFLDKATRVVERALTETQVDIFTDYQADGADQDLLDPLNGEALSSSRVFCDEAWTKNRIVSAVEWSTVHPELIYTAYGAKQSGSLHDPEGVVCVWNTKYKKDTPEFVFHCPSPITSLALSPYSPNLTIGGTYSGQIVIWDNRSRKRTPVQRSKHIAKSHTHPIYCLDLVGSKNSHNLISVSSDGRVCSWSLDMLAQPQEPPFDLTHPSDKRRSISVMSSSFPRANTNQFLIGCEDGGVYQAQRHGNKSGITDMFGYGGVGGSMASSTLSGFSSGASTLHSLTMAHSGPVFGLSCHQAAGTLDFSDLFLTASADWSIKLWSTKYNTGSSISTLSSGKEAASTNSASNSSIIPSIHAFENNQDYLYDIAWSPAHPAVFVCGDGQANIDLWDINTHTEMPIATHKMKGGSQCISKLAWSQKGDMLAVGDDIGRIELLEVNEQLHQPANEEWSKFMTTVQELTQTSNEEARTDFASKSATSRGAGDFRSSRMASGL